MKRELSIITCLFALNFYSEARHYVLPVVDERVELLSIVYRLARPNDFVDNGNRAYLNAVSNHFSSYSNHPLISYFNHVADSLQKKNIEFGYWDALALAVHLSHPPKLEPVVPLHSVPPDGWDNRTMFLPKLVGLLQMFYRDARCRDFFKSQAKYYQRVHDAYRKKGVKIDAAWFRQFFGMDATEKYYPILGLMMGEADYFRVDYQNNYRDTYTVFGCKNFDDNGVPTNFSDPVFSRLIPHELIHAFSNQFVDKHKSELQPSAEILIANPKVYALMKDTFYGNWQFLLYESMVRACYIKYLMATEKDKSVSEREFVKQEELGFVWIRGLVGELAAYESNRANYETIEMFMPMVVAYFGKVAGEMTNQP
jgi:Domain of unknown function (DUF4932)